MKKLIAVVLCFIMMATMIPSFFASAAAAPAAAGEVAAQNDDSGDDILSAFSGFFELWGGLLKLIIGSDTIKELPGALKDALKLVSIGEFFSTVRLLWDHIVS